MLGENFGKKAVELDDFAKRLAANLLAGVSGFAGDIASAVGHMRQGEGEYDEEDEPYFSADEVQDIGDALRGIDRRISEGNDNPLYDVAHFVGREAPAYVVGSVVPGAPIAKALLGAGVETAANSSGLYDDLLQNGASEEEAISSVVNASAEEFLPNLVGHSLSRVAPILRKNGWRYGARAANSASEANQQRISSKYHDDEDSAFDVLKAGLLGLGF